MLLRLNLVDYLLIFILAAVCLFVFMKKNMAHVNLICELVDPSEGSSL